MKKNTGQLFFGAESIYEISNPYLKLVTDGRTVARTHARKHGQTSPTQYAPSTYFKVGGIKNTLKMGAHPGIDPVSLVS